MADQNLNSHDIPSAARELRKQVNSLLGVYFMLILGTLILFFAVLGGALFGVYSMLQDGYFSYRAITLLIALVVMAGVCVKVILGPLVHMFDKKETVGTEITRNEYPELFALIDEIVAKAGCEFPKHVYVYNDCNAFVSCKSIWGYLFKARKNLTIGLPLLYTLNKSELKAILSHEFGHFTQKSITINSVANLSEYICTAIAASLEEIENEDPETRQVAAHWFAAVATRIMARQYHKVAPLNAILSRAQEYEADMFSYSIAGSEATISALSKVERFTERWRMVMGVLSNYVHDKRRPDDIYDFVQLYNKFCNELMVVDSETVLDQPHKTVKNNVMFSADTATHPDMADRCDTIKSQTPVPTVWDKTPAISYFSDGMIRAHFNQIPDEIAKVMFPYSTMTFFKKNIPAAELEDIAKYHSMEYLKWFYELFLFVAPDALSTEGAHPEYEAFPFTESNVVELMEHQRNCDDLTTLENLVQENSPERKFIYCGRNYTGVNVPIADHREVVENSLAKCVEIARHCNYWIRKNSKCTYLAGQFEMMLYSLKVLSALSSIRDNMDVIYQIYSAKDESTKAKEYIRPVDEYYRNVVADIFNEDESGSSRFTQICDFNKVPDDVVMQVKSYFRDKSGSVKNMLASYQSLYRILMVFKLESWKMIVRELVIPGKSPLPSKFLEENEEYFS